MTPRVAVLQFPGVNCEAETERALTGAGLAAERVPWTAPPARSIASTPTSCPAASPTRIACAPARSRRRTRLLDVLARARPAGTPVLGICNGAQVLVEAGLVPGRCHLGRDPVGVRWRAIACPIAPATTRAGCRARSRRRLRVHAGLRAGRARAAAHGARRGPLHRPRPRQAWDELAAGAPGRRSATMPARKPGAGGGRAASAVPGQSQRSPRRRGAALSQRARQRARAHAAPGARAGAGAGAARLARTRGASAPPARRDERGRAVVGRTRRGVFLSLA